MAIESITVKNFRRFSEESTISIKPITVLLGRNSSGKSTLLRLTPLLRQSLTTRTNAPLLWYGDLVDFGDYESVVTAHDRAREIEIGFSSKPRPIPRRRLVDRNYRAFESDSITVGQFKCHYRLSTRERAGKTTTSLRSARIEYPERDVKLLVEFSSEGKMDALMVGDVNISTIADISNVRIGRRIFAPLSMIFLRNDGFFTGDRDFFSALLLSVLRTKMDKRISDVTLQQFAVRMLFSAPFDYETIKAAANHTGLITISQFVDTHLSYENEFQRRVKAILDLYFGIRVSDINLQEIQEIFSESLYIGPARVRSDRYYRYQELAVSEILPDGSNLPMFLNSLTPSQLTDFSGFVERSFGFGIILDPAGGHISIRLKYAYDTTNIVDAGFGVSQLLPILSQLWWATSRYRRGRARLSEQPATTVLAMEQPELHLHPAHQAKLADVFAHSVNAVRDHTSLRLVVETHSSELVNRLGVLIERGILLPEDVDIYVVDEDIDQPEATSSAKLTLATFDKRGVLQNWPTGFFTPDIL